MRQSVLLTMIGKFNKDSDAPEMEIILDAVKSIWCFLNKKTREPFRIRKKRGYEKSNGNLQIVWNGNVSRKENFTLNT